MRAVQRGIFRLPRRALRRSARLLQRFQPLRSAHDHKDAERDGERADGKSRRCAHGQKGFARFAAESRDHCRFQGEQGDGGVSVRVAEGQAVGRVRVTLDGEILADYPITCRAAVEPMTFSAAFDQLLRAAVGGTEL